MSKRAQGRVENGKLRSPSQGFGIATWRFRPGRAANDNHQPLSRRLTRWPVIAFVAVAVGSLCYLALALMPAG